MKIWVAGLALAAGAGVVTTTAPSTVLADPIQQLVHRVTDNVPGGVFCCRPSPST